MGKKVSETTELSGNKSRPRYDDVEFSAMRRRIRDSDLTDYQRKKNIEPYIGKRVLWQGWVENVEGYIVHVDMDEPEVFNSVYDFEIPVDDELASMLRRDQVVYVTGIIRSIKVGVLGDFSVNLEGLTLLTTKP